MKAVDKNTVTITATLGSGGQGTVHDAEVRTGSGETRRFAYKHYCPGRDTIDYRVLDAQIGVGDRRTPHDRNLLLTSAAWPQAVVADPEHGPDGFLMGVLPPEFFLPGTDQTPAGSRPAEIQHLLNGPEFAHRLSLTYSRADQ